MRRWDRLQDAYMEEYRARGVSEATALYTEARLDRWGRWLKKRRPRVVIEDIDAVMITRYFVSCTSFRSKATVYGTLSTMRGFGDYMVRQGLWMVNPLRWMKGPKVTPYSRLPKRIGHVQMEALWRAAVDLGGAYSSHLWVTILALLYGTGLRRGELARLTIASFDRNEGTLRIDGRKTGQERSVPLPEMVLRCLEAYLPLRHNQLEQVGHVHETALLVSRYGRPLSGSAISNGVRDVARAAQVPIHSVHQFRQVALPTCWKRACTWPRCNAFSGTPSSRPLSATCTSLIRNVAQPLPFTPSTIGCNPKERPHDEAQPRSHGSFDRRLSQLSR